MFTTLVLVSAPEMMDPIETVKSQDSKTLIVEFTERTGATSYLIRVQNSMGYFTETSVTSSPAQIQSLTPYTDYTLSIMSVNSGGRSQPSAPVETKTGIVAPHITYINL